MKHDSHLNKTGNGANRRKEKILNNTKFIINLGITTLMNVPSEHHLHPCKNTGWKRCWILYKMLAGIISNWYAILDIKIGKSIKLTDNSKEDSPSSIRLTSRC